MATLTGMSVDDLRAQVDAAIEGLRSELVSRAEQRGYENPASVGALLKSAVLAKLIDDPQAEDVLADNPDLLSHRDALCWAVQQSEQEGCRNEIEGYVYSKLDEV